MKRLMLSAVLIGLASTSCAKKIAECQADGEVDCIANAAFPAMIAEGASGKIIEGQILGGVTGGSASTDSATGSTSTAGGVATPAQTSPVGSVASSAQTIANCTAEGELGCITVEAFPPVDKSRLQASATSELIHSSLSIAGVQGSMPLCGADGSACYLPLFANGSQSKKAVDILTLPTPCTGDGLTGCVTTSVYKSVDTGAFDAWDIRSGKTLGGVPGGIQYFKNAVDAYNRTTGTAAEAGVDVYDTVDDRAMPLNVPTGFPAPSTTHWKRDTASDTNGDHSCDGSEDCVYIDRLTGLRWAKPDGVNRTWENAITHCDGRTYGTYTKWRLPTQKELMVAYANNIHYMKAALGDNTMLWSSTTLPNLPNAAWALEQFDGLIYFYDKASAFGALCVR